MAEEYSCTSQISVLFASTGFREFCRVERGSEGLEHTKPLFDTQQHGYEIIRQQHYNTSQTPEVLQPYRTQGADSLPPRLLRGANPRDARAAPSDSSKQSEHICLSFRARLRWLAHSAHGCRGWCRGLVGSLLLSPDCRWHASSKVQSQQRLEKRQA